MGLEITHLCTHCQRSVDQLYEVGWEHQGNFVKAGICCLDCAPILKERIEEMARHITLAKLN